MNKAVFCKIFLINTLLLLSCENENTFERDSLKLRSGTDWESRGLFGEIKSVTLYKATFVDRQGEKTREPSKTFKEVFTEFGSLQKTESYDNFGDLIQTTTNEFDKNKYLIKSIYLDNFRPFKTVTTIKYDTLNNIAIWNVVVNDSLNYKIIEKSDLSGELIERVSVHKNDTVISKATIEYDENDRIVLKKVSSTNQYDDEIFKYTYDSYGNLIESITGNEGMKFKSISEYDGNHIVLDTLYIIGGDNEEHLSKVITYDKLFNTLNQKIYENSELNREFKNVYDMDQNGNWIKGLFTLKNILQTPKNLHLPI